MTKSELVAHLAEEAGLPKKQTEQFLNALISKIGDILSSGETLRLPGLGTFSVKSRSARDGRNPSTGATIKIPACKVPTFKAGKELKEKVNA